MKKKLPWSITYSNDLSKITQAIKEGYDPDSYSPSGVSIPFTPLISAIISQDSKKDEVINSLLDAKASPTLGDDKNLPPIHYALTHNSGLKTVQRLLDAKALPYWGEDSKTAVVSLYEKLPKDQINIEHLHILMRLLMAGAEKVVFSGYDQFAKDDGFSDAGFPLPCAYAFLAIFGHFFLDSLKSTSHNQPLIQILHEIFLPVLGTLILNYVVEPNSDYLIKAVERIVWCLKTNLLGDNVYHLIEGSINETPAWPLPYSELSLAVYNYQLSKAQRLIDTKADVTFTEIDSGYSTLDYAVKSNPDADQEGPTMRFKRVKMITDTLRDRYQQTLLGAAQKTQPKPELTSQHLTL